jgi:hypothetical protein
MAFLNFSLLAGGALVAIPVILHLAMRQRPRTLLFPALQLVRQRHTANQRQLRVRHWLLLALRMLVLGLAALALARPSVPSAAVSSWLACGLLAAGAIGCCAVAGLAALKGTSRVVVAVPGGLGLLLAIAATCFAISTWRGSPPLAGSQEAPVAACLILDNSPRMSYLHENRTRLEIAQDLAGRLLPQFPEGSEVAVLDTRSSGGAFAIDRAAADRAIQRLPLTTAPRPLAEVVLSGLKLLLEKRPLRKELYVFTDLAGAAWDSPATADLRRELAAHPDVLLYLVDVGVPRPRNVALGLPILSGEILPAGSDLSLEVPVEATGVGGVWTVELWMEPVDPTLPILRDGKPVLPRPVLRDSREISLQPGERQTVQFRVSGSVAGDRASAGGPGSRGLEVGLHPGWVRLAGKDSLPMDDVRYFVVDVQPPWPVLIVSPSDVSPSYLAEALAPRELREAGSAPFHCQTLDASALEAHPLDEYRAVALLDPRPLAPEVWAKLAAYVAEGGGLAIFLGQRAGEAGGMNDPAALRVLGGKLTRVARTPGDVFLAPTSYEHPVLATLRPIATRVPWDLFPVFFHWNLEELAATARVVIPYSDGKPALVEQRLGRGSVLVLTTPISDPPQPSGYAPWNELATGSDAWPCFVLVNEALRYLVKSQATRLNLLCGQTAVLPNEAGRYPQRYQLFPPSEQPQDVLANDGQLTIRFTLQPGLYRLRGQLEGPVSRGLAINLAPEHSQLARLSPAELDERLGPGRYRLARTTDELNRAVGTDRVGVEFYPLLALLLALALGLEHLLSNRFYPASPEMG